MKLRSLAARGLRHYWRTHLGVVVGAAVATAALVGALVVGDSVRGTLRQHALDRVGRVHSALVTPERSFGADLAQRLSLSGTASAGLAFRGIASARGGEARAGIVEVLGVDNAFFALSPEGAGSKPAAGRVHLNRALATHLDVTTGDSILVRVERPSLVPRETALAKVDDISFAIPVEVERVLDAGEFGRFGLRAAQGESFRVFADVTWLGEQLDLAGRANLLLVDVIPDGADAALAKAWTFDDAQIEFRELDAGVTEMRSSRVFLDDAVVDTLQMTPPLIGVFTYFVNAIRSGDRVTPYSMISAIGVLGGGPLDPALQPLGELATEANAVVVNDWLARDLEIELGDEIEIEYFTLDDELGLATHTSKHRVSRVTPLEGVAADASLMPAFPGLAGAESCRDWDPGMPVDLERLRDQDQQYWEEHGGTPKAFVSLPRARKAWRNRYGSLTAVRMPTKSVSLVKHYLGGVVEPSDLGLFFRDVRTPALAAGSPATDFGGLFLGLSFFLIVAALLLCALLFVFGVEQRASEVGLLLAVGYRPREVRRVFLRESVGLAGVGSALGALIGLGYSALVLYGLGSLWRGAVGGTALELHYSASTIAIGIAAGIATAAFAIWLALRRAFDRPAIELLRSGRGVALHGNGARSPRRAWIVAGVAAVLAIALAPTAGGSAQARAGAFFGAGALLLIASLCACLALLIRSGRPTTSPLATVRSLGARSAGRRLGRSLTTIALLASGTFLVVAIQANRLIGPEDPTNRASGTGGFALYGRTTLPVLRDLTTEEGRRAYGVEDEDLEGASIVPFRVREGDDASCLNLATPQHPRLIGVDPAELASRHAFTFPTLHFGGGVTEDEARSMLKSMLPWGRRDGSESPWSLLAVDYGEDVVPAIGDAASVTWTLHKAVGDDVRFVDEMGEEFKVRIVGVVQGSILQGNLVVADAHFRERFPSIPGHRMFLIDAEDETAVSSTLTNALEDLGFEATTTRARLAEFSAVQNTYLSIFQVLGALGVLLGTVGLGAVVLRNTFERRGELAVASAVGFARRDVMRLVASEHRLLLGMGLVSGGVAAVVALSGAGTTAWLAPLGWGLAIAAGGVVCVHIATRIATRRRALDDLRADE